MYSVVAAATLELAEIIHKIEGNNRKKSKDRRFWISPFYLERGPGILISEMYNKLNNVPLSEYANTNAMDFFKNFVRMGFNDFNVLLDYVRPAIEKQDTNMRKAIPAEERLAVTLRYLATGENFRSLRYV